MEDWQNKRCYLDGYLTCAAKIPEACLCDKMPRQMIEEKLKQERELTFSNEK